MSKGLDALRAQRQADESCAEALRRVGEAFLAGFDLPDVWCKRDGAAVIVEFAGWTSLQLRVGAGALRRHDPEIATTAHDFPPWSLWFAGARIGLFRSPHDALAEAKARGFLTPAKERTSL